MQSAADGQTTFLVLMADQANLAPAEAIHDWQARGRWVHDVLRETAETSQRQLRRTLASKAANGHVSRWQSLWIVNSAIVRGDLEAAQSLARLPGVAGLLPSYKLDPPEPIPAPSPELERQSTAGVEWNLRAINADDVWDLGYTGEGMVAANVDTGVDYTHPALVRQYRGNQGIDSGGPFQHDFNWFDPFWGSPAPQALPHVANGDTPNSHGTHVMGTAVGSDGGANQIGVAPDARWIASYGCCPDNATLLAALQWMLAPTRLNGSDPNPDLRPHTLQNSWGGPGGSLIFQQAMAALKAAGIFVSASAGNNGSACGTLGSPGDNPALFNVGASTSGAGIAGFSARGPDPFSSETGPDLVAPGQGIRSSVVGGYAAANGTSMAGPHVAGAVTLLWQANPALMGRVDDTAELLRKTASPIYVDGETCGGVDSATKHPNNSAGWGQLDILRAVKVAGDGSTGLTVRVVDDQRNPLPGVTISLQVTTPEGTTVELDAIADQAGEHQFLVAAGSVVVTAQAFGYQPTTVRTNVGGAQEEITLQVSELSRYVLTGLVVEQAPHLLHLPLVSGGVAGTGAQGARSDSGLAPAYGQALAARITVLGAPIKPVETDCNGAFELSLPAGQHRLRIQAAGYEDAEITVDVGDRTMRTIRMVPAWDYLVADSRSDEVTFRWIDATSGQRYNLDDDESRRLDLPMDFDYYGQAYQQLYISSNGFVTFGTPQARFHGVIPFEGAPNNAIYAYAEDLNPAADLQYGTGYDNGIYSLIQDETLVLQYNEVEHWSSGLPETFQLNLDLATGEITFQYQEVSWPDFTTVGVEDALGARGIAYSEANSANLEAGLAVRFMPVFGQSGQVCDG